MAVINGKIKCSGCKHQKEISCFTPFIVRRGSGLCKPCRNAYKKQLYHRDVEKARKQYKEYRIKKGPEWKNIEDIIKFTFRALNEIVISHSITLKDIERSLASKVSKADFYSETSKKVDSLCFLDQLKIG